MERKNQWLDRESRRVRRDADAEIQKIASELAEVRERAAKQIATMHTQLREADELHKHLIREQDQQSSRLRTDCDLQIAAKENELRSLRELEIPRLEKKLAVAEGEIELLKTWHARELTRIESEIAVYNSRIVDAELRGPPRPPNYVEQLK